MLRAIIFDMDGVICDSEPSHMKALQQVLLESGVAITDQEYYDKYIAFDDRGSIKAALVNHGQTEPTDLQLKKLVSRKATVFEQYMKDGLVIFPGVEPFIRRIGNRYSLALATGARRLEVEFVLKKAKLRDAFATIVSADDVKEGKPGPEAFVAALKGLNDMRLNGTPEIKPSEIVVIEDSPSCIRTVKGLGMKAVGMAGSFETAALSHADLVIDSFVGLSTEPLEKLFV